ncbi:MAG: fumarate hydratase [Patescibacteria group bacterium]
MNYGNLEKKLVDLFQEAACNIPSDVAEALIKARKKEKAGSLAHEIFSIQLENMRQAQEKGRPMCQDTGIPVFYINCPKKSFDPKIIEVINKATMIASKKVPLRSNTVRVSDNKNIGYNLPEINLDFQDRKDIEINFMLKGGGSENVSQIFKVAGSKRDETGIIKKAVQTVFEARGRGCSPGILGIAVAGSQTQALKNAKKMLLGKVGHKRNKLEEKIYKLSNQLGIGPYGLGGKTTILDVFVNDLSKSYRHPATFFVAVSYMCYADRKKTLAITDNRIAKMRNNERTRKIKFPKFDIDSSKYKIITAPINKNYDLKAGDRVLLTGEITTARDQAYNFLINSKKKLDISNVIYHCGILRCGNCICSAGPTTSARMDEYGNKLINKYNIKAIIGKGGMKKIKTVFLEAFGGVGVIPANLMKIKKSYKREFGDPEAIWNINIKEPGMPLLVTRDKKGNDLYEKIENKSRKIYEAIN